MLPARHRDAARDLFAVVALVSAAGLVALGFGGWAVVLFGGLPVDPIPFLGTSLAVHAALAGVTGAYLASSGRGLAYLDVGPVTVSTVRDALGGVLAIGVSTVVIVTAAVALGAAPTFPSVFGAPITPAALLVAAPFTAFVGAPVQEILFRNGCQKRLRGTVPVPVAIAVTSLLFVAFTLAPYTGPSLGRLAAPAAVVFVASAIIGAVYERTGNLLAAIFVNAAVTVALLALLSLVSTA